MKIEVDFYTWQWIVQNYVRVKATVRSTLRGVNYLTINENKKIGTLG